MCDAVLAGIPVKVQYTDSTYGLLSFTAFNVAESLSTIVSQSVVYYNGVYILAELYGGIELNVWGFKSTALAQKTDIPTALPSPNSLTFTGAVTGTYNGSNPMTVKIPLVDDTLTQSGQVADAKAVGDVINHVNSAIEAKQDHLTEQDKQEIVLTGITTAVLGDEERKVIHDKLTIIKPLLDGIAVVGAQYYLGECKTVSIVLPDNAEISDMITVIWYNGDTPATLSITGKMLDFNFVPSANTRSEINALYDGLYWAVLGNEIVVPSEVTE